MKRLSDTRELDTMIAAWAKIPTTISREGAVLVDKYLEEGAEEQRKIIESSDTPFGLSQGRKGRVDEGYLLGDVTRSEVTKTRNRISGSFGWGSTGGDVHDYYKYQEQGFQHWRSGKDVAPMHALLGAFISVRERFYDDVLRMLKGLV